MIDIHAHVLPDVDDGPVDLASAVELCRSAGRDGVETIVATPHQRHESWENADRARLERLRDAVQHAVGASPRILLGAEIAVDSELLAELDRFPDCEWLPLAGSRYLLLELNPMSPRVGPHPLGLVHELRLAGWRPILAHPERCSRIADDPALVAQLALAGALVQVTAGSLTGRFGPQIQGWVLRMLDQDRIDFVASDMHDVEQRPPELAVAFEVVRRLGAVAIYARPTASPQR